MAVDYSIWVHHGNNLKDDLLAEVDSLWFVGKKKLKNSLHYPWAHCFSRVLSGDYDYSLSLFAFFSRTWSNNNILAAVISNRLCQRPHMKEILILFIFLDRLYKVHQLVIGIRKRLSKEDLVSWIIESERKAQRVMAFHAFTFCFLEIWFKTT